MPNVVHTECEVCDTRSAGAPITVNAFGTHMHVSFTSTDLYPLQDVGCVNSVTLRERLEYVPERRLSTSVTFQIVTYVTSLRRSLRTPTERTPVVTLITGCCRMMVLFLQINIHI